MTNRKKNYNEFKSNLKGKKSKDQLREMIDYLKNNSLSGETLKVFGQEIVKPFIEHLSKEADNSRECKKGLERNREKLIDTIRFICEQELSDEQAKIWQAVISQAFTDIDKEFRQEQNLHGILAGVGICGGVLIILKIISSLGGSNVHCSPQNLQRHNHCRFNNGGKFRSPNQFNRAA